MRGLPHIFGRAFNQPLAITVSRLEPLIAGLRAAAINPPRPQALREDDDEYAPPPLPMDGAWSYDRRRGYALSSGGIARLTVHDVLVKRAGQVEADSTELESYAHIGTVLRNALGDRRVKAVMLDIDSPGGESAGLFELARDIRTAATVKPIWASVNDDALSAGYAIASAAARIFVTSTGGVGSIGVIAMHTDVSAFDQKQGFAFQYIYAGDRKADYNPHAPLSTEARKLLKAEVDRLYGMFVDQVASYRGMTAKAVAATQAGIYYGENAVAIGLADDVGTFGEAVAAMTEALGELDMTVENEPVDGTGGAPLLAAAPPAAPEPSAATSLPAAEMNALQDGVLEAIGPAAVQNVVRIDHVRQATSNVRKDAVEIVNLCTLAGMAHLAADFIKTEATVAAVRADLQRRQSEIAAAAQVLPIDTTQTQASHAETQRSEMSKVVAERFALQSGRKG
jgi:capsid assembly protease